jgi:hypothetical protein
MRVVLAQVYDVNTSNDRDCIVVKVREYEDREFKKTSFVLFPIPTSIREIIDSVVIRTKADRVIMQENLLYYVPFAR